MTKFKDAKTTELRYAIWLLDLYRFKATLTEIKVAAKVAGLDLKGRTFKAAYPQLIEHYNQALVVEEAETLVIL